MTSSHFILIFQFEKVNVFLSQKFSKELYVWFFYIKRNLFVHGWFFRLASIGLEIVPSNALVVKLLIPSIFLVVNILQLHYLHSGWMELIPMPKYL